MWLEISFDASSREGERRIELTPDTDVNERIKNVQIYDHSKAHLSARQQNHKFCLNFAARLIKVCFDNSVKIWQQQKENPTPTYNVLR